MGSLPNVKTTGAGEFLKLIGDVFDDMETLVRNIFGLTEVERKSAVDNSKQISNGLRE